MNHNVALQPHWDFGNLRGTLNNLIGLGDYSGGQLWVQLFDNEVDGEKHVEWMLSDRNEKNAWPSPVTRAPMHSL